MAKEGLSDRNLIRAIKANVAKGKMTDAQFRHFIMESLDLLEEPAKVLDDRRRQEIVEAALSYAYSNVNDLNDAYGTEEDNLLLVRGRLISPFNEDDFKRILAELDEPDGVRFVQSNNKEDAYRLALLKIGAQHPAWSSNEQDGTVRLCNQLMAMARAAVGAEGRNDDAKADWCSREAERCQ